MKHWWIYEAEMKALHYAPIFQVSSITTIPIWVYAYTYFIEYIDYALIIFKPRSQWKWEPSTVSRENIQNISISLCTIWHPSKNCPYTITMDVMMYNIHASCFVSFLTKHCSFDELNDRMLLLLLREYSMNQNYAILPTIVEPEGLVGTISGD